MGYNKLDKINTLVALETNNGNKSQTAKEMGVSRQTLINWVEQLESDMKLKAQVEAAKQNLANIEEITAMKALAEISRRLDSEPEKIKDNDLRAYKDSAINNSRLIRGEATVIHGKDAITHVLDYAKQLLATQVFTLEQIAEQVRKADFLAQYGAGESERERIAADIPRLLENK